MNAIIAGEPYPVTAAITLANNPLLALPNSGEKIRSAAAFDRENCGLKFWAILATANKSVKVFLLPSYSETPRRGHCLRGVRCYPETILISPSRLINKQRDLIQRQKRFP